MSIFGNNLNITNNDKITSTRLSIPTGLFCNIIYLVPIFDWNVYQFGRLVDSVYSFRGRNHFVPQILCSQNQRRRKIISVLVVYKRSQGNRVERIMKYELKISYWKFIIRIFIFWMFPSV